MSQMPDSASKQNSPKILMVGAAVDEETMDLLWKVDKRPQIQTYRFHWAVIDAIESARGAPIDIVSTVPTRDYPRGRKILWGRRKIKREGYPNAQFTLMPFVNLLGLKQVTRFASSFLFTLAWLWKRRRTPDKTMLVYGLILPHMMATLLLARLFGAKTVAIVTDPPTSLQIDEGLVYAIARRLDRALILGCLRRMDAMIALTRQIQERLAPSVPALIVEGIISREVEEFTKRAMSADATDGEAGPFIAMYAGSLRELYGIDILVEAFRQLDDPEAALWLCGHGPMEEAIRQAAEDDPRIVYWGSIADLDVLYDKISTATVMVNPRPPDDAYTSMSFPSKTLEYLALGKLLITARLAGIPDDYVSHLICVEEMTPARLADRLREVARMSPEDRKQRESAATAFVWAGKTAQSQGERVMAFLEAVTEEPPRPATDDAQTDKTPRNVTGGANR